MKIHYVFSHPTMDSFNGALLDTAKSALKNHWVTYTDLYAQSFDPVVGAGDLAGAFGEDVKKEIAHIQQADLLILQFPLWWFSTPAILKGWMDRVFAFGVAYDSERRFKTGGFSGKKAMLVVTTQGPESSYQVNAANGTMDAILFPIHHALQFVGFETLPPFVGYGVLANTKTENQNILKNYTSTLSNKFFRMGA